MALATTGFWFSATARLGISSWPLNLAAATATTVLAVALLHRSRGGARSWHPREWRIRVDLPRSIAVLTGVASIVLGASQFLGSTMLPTSPSPDLPHHLTLTQWVIDHGAVPTELTSNLGEMYAYPFSAHVFAATASQLLGLDPIRAVSLSAFAFLALSAAALVAVAGSLSMRLWPEATQRRRQFVWSAALLSVLGFLLIDRLTMNSITVDFFFAQALGLYLVCACVLFAVESSREPRCSWLAVGAACAMLVGYPLFLPAVGPLLLLVAAVRWRTCGWRLAAAFAAVSVALLAGTAAVFLPGRLGVGKAILRNEGGITEVTVDVLGGWPLVLLCSAGAIVTLVGALRKREPTLVVVPLVALTALLTRAVMLRVDESGGSSSAYQATKLVYVMMTVAVTLAPVFACAVADAVARLSGRVSSRQLAALPSLAACGVLAFEAFGPLYGEPPPSLPPDAYAVARWARTHVDPTEVEVGIGAMAGYTLWVGVLGRPRDERALSYLSGSFDVIGRWSLSDDDYFLAMGEPQHAELVARSGPVETVFRSGEAMLLRRL